MPPLLRIQLGSLTIARLVAGSNAISGFSHQSESRSAAMRRYFTVARIKEHLAECERHGVDAIVARADNFTMRVLAEYWDEGGSIRWIAQTAPEHRDPVKLIAQLARAGASAAFVHGGEVDRNVRSKNVNAVRAQVDAIRERGLPAGVAAHAPAHHRALRDAGVGVDFHLVCLYDIEGYRGNATREPVEVFDPEDRAVALALLRELEPPAIAYKVYGAGRATNRESLDDVMRALRPKDGVLVGMFPPDHPSIVADNVARVARWA
jgi:hypothetical protein